MNLGPYALGAEIGRGGSGVVFRGRAPDGTEVAIKLLQNATPGATQRFERERRLLGSLGRAQGFVPLLDAGESPHGPWIVMPLLAGGSLRERLDRGALSIESVIDLGITLGRALGAAHAKGVVHRDLKPENVLYDDRDARKRPLIVDLGLAKHFDDAAPGASRSISVSQHGSFRGTPAYMAPEQMLDSKTAGPRADVYALGTILYEALAGQTPYDAPTPIETLTRVTEGRLPPLGPRRRDAPAWLVGAVEMACAFDARVRFSDGQALADEFERAHDDDQGLSPGRKLAPIALALGGAVALLVIGVLAGRFVSLGTPRPSATKSPGPVASMTATSRREQVKSALQEHHVAAALELALEGVRLEPGSALAWALRGLCRSERHEDAAALEDLDHAVELDASNALVRAIRARARIAHADLDGAEADAGRAIELDPKLALGWTARGIVHAKRNDRRSALEDLDRAIAADPDDALARLARADVRRQSFDLENARADADFAVALDPKGPAAWATRGEIARLRLDAAGAQSDFEHALALDPQNTFALSHRGLLRSDMGDLKGALEDAERCMSIDRSAGASLDRSVGASLDRSVGASLDRSVGASLDRSVGASLGPSDRTPEYALRADLRLKANDLDGARADAETSIAKNPREPLGWEVRGEVESARGQWEPAFSDFDRALSLTPLQARALRGRANARIARKDYDGALADLDLGVQLEPKNPRAYEARGDVRHAVGNYKGSLEDLDRAVALGSIDPQSRGLRGAVRFSFGDLAGAMADFDYTISKLPQHALAYLSRGEVRRKLGDISGALDDLGRGLAISPETAIGLVSRGAVRRSLGQVDDALADFEHALRIDPRMSNALAYRGLIRCEHHDPERGLEDLDRAVELLPAPLSLTARAQARIGTGDFGGAIADANQSLALDPRDPSTLATRGEAKRHLGDLDAALEDFTRSLEVKDDPASRILRAQTLVAKGDLVGARRDAERAIALQPSRLDSHLWLARILERAGNREAAIAEVQGVIERTTDAAVLVEARTLLAELEAAAPK